VTGLAATEYAIFEDDVAFALAGAIRFPRPQSCILRFSLRPDPGSREVSSSIIDVQRGASATGSASSQVLSSAQALTTESHRLKSEMGRFFGTVRSA
jgi:hypothetical protein